MDKNIVFEEGHFRECSPQVDDGFLIFPGIYPHPYKRIKKKIFSDLL
jgi:hypothetical protein